MLVVLRTTSELTIGFGRSGSGYAIEIRTLEQPANPPTGGGTITNAAAAADPLGPTPHAKQRVADTHDQRVDRRTSASSSEGGSANAWGTGAIRRMNSIKTAR